jgi:hypothetical protein
VDSPRVWRELPPAQHKTTLDIVKRKGALVPTALVAESVEPDMEAEEPIVAVVIGRNHVDDGGVLMIADYLRLPTCQNSL